MNKLLTTISLLIPVLFLIPMAHSQDEIYVAQGISITDCAEFTHGYGLSLSPGRMDGGYGLGLSIDGFSSSFLEQYKDRINIGDRVVGLQTDFGIINIWDMPFISAAGYVRAFAGANTDLVIIPANQELHQQNESVISLPLTEIEHLSPEDEPGYADYSILYPDDPKHYRCSYGDDESPETRLGIYIGPIDKTGEKVAGVGEYVRPSYYLRGLLTESQDGNLLGNGLYIFTQRKLENLSYAFDSQIGTWNKENQFTGEKEIWISEDVNEFVKVITNYDSGIVVEKVVESQAFSDLDTPPTITREVFGEDINFNEPPDKYVDFLEKVNFYTPYAEGIRDGVIKAFECETPRSYNFLTNHAKPDGLSNCLINVFSVASSEQLQELYTLKMAVIWSNNSDRTFSEVAPAEVVKKVADGVLRIKFSEGGLTIVDFPSGLTFEGEFPFGDEEQFLNANLLADTTKRGISYLNGVGLLYETGSRRSRQRAESLQYLNGRPIPRASQSNNVLNRTTAISQRNNQIREDYKNARSQTGARQTQRRTIQKESFWDKALKVVVGVVVAYAAYELIDAIAESSSTVSNQVASRARPRSNMLLPSQARDSDVQAPPMIRFGWDRDSGVRYMNQPTYQTYMTSLQSNFNQNVGYLSGSTIGSTCSYNSQGEVFRISRVVLGAGCPFNLKLPNVYSDERFALNQINRRPNGLTVLLNMSENYFGKNYCMYTLVGRSPVILPKGKTAQCSPNINL